LDQLLLSLAALAGFAFDDMTRMKAGDYCAWDAGSSGCSLLPDCWRSTWRRSGPPDNPMSNGCWSYDSNRIYRSRYVVRPGWTDAGPVGSRFRASTRAGVSVPRHCARSGNTEHSLGITGEMGLDEAIPQLTDAKLNALEAEERTRNRPGAPWPTVCVP